MDDFIEKITRDMKASPDILLFDHQGRPQVNIAMIPEKTAKIAIGSLLQDHNFLSLPIKLEKS